MFGGKEENHEQSQSELPMIWLRFNTAIPQIHIYKFNTTPFGTHDEKERHECNTKGGLHISISCSSATYIMSVHTATVDVTGFQLVDPSRTRCLSGR
jgi:hypothetical protein